VIPQMAALSPGMSGAQIANVCNEAALIAARRGADTVDVEDFFAAADRVIAGPEKRSRVLQESERRIVA
jgi:ATP-dependent Zn protease